MARYLFLWAPPLKWPRWAEKCLYGELGYQRHYHLFANDKEPLTASAPAAPSLWFSAHFSPADKTLLRSIFHFLSKHPNTWPAKSLHTSNVESGKKLALMNFVASSSSGSEQLKGERLWLRFRVANLLLGSLLGKVQAARPNSPLTPDNWKPSPASINQTLRRPLVSVQNCNYFRAFSKPVGCFTRVCLRQHLLRSFNKAAMPDFD